MPVKTHRDQSPYDRHPSDDDFERLNVSNDRENMYQGWIIEMPMKTHRDQLESPYDRPSDNNLDVLNDRGNEGDCDIYDICKWGHVAIFEEVPSGASKLSLETTREKK